MSANDQKAYKQTRDFYASIRQFFCIQSYFLINHFSS